MLGDISVSCMPRTCELKCSKMYNMNSSGLLPVVGGEAGGATPRTPEILNSLMAMTNPFDMTRHGGGPRVASSPPSDTTSTSSSSTSSVSPPSVQHTCSQLIKEGLKLTIQTKRKNNPSTSSCGEDTPSKSSLSEDINLTPEDEERRRRRRERNKIAATKCRLKKRERTVNLVQESEILETQNMDLKSQIQDLENERKRLVDMLTVHRPTCSKQPPFANVMSPSPYPEASPYPQRSSSSSVETSPAAYSPYQTPYCKVEESCETSYHKTTSTTVSENTYQRLETVEEIGYNHAPAQYHTFEPSAKDSSSSMLSYCREGDTYLRPESTYSTLSIESSHSHSYTRQHESPRHFNRSTPLGQVEFKSGKDTNLSSNSFHNYNDDNDSYNAGFTSGSCIS